MSDSEWEKRTTRSQRRRGKLDYAQVAKAGLVAKNTEDRESSNGREKKSAKNVKMSKAEKTKRTKAQRKQSAANKRAENNLNEELEDDVVSINIENDNLQELEHARVDGLIAEAIPSTSGVSNVGREENSTEQSSGTEDKEKSASDREKSLSRSRSNSKSPNRSESPNSRDEEGKSDNAQDGYVTDGVSKKIKEKEEEIKSMRERLRKIEREEKKRKQREKKERQLERLRQEEKELKRQLKKKEEEEKKEKKAARKRRAEEKRKEASKNFNSPEVRRTRVGEKKKGKVKSSTKSKALVAHISSAMPNVDDMANLLNIAERSKRVSSTEGSSDSCSDSTTTTTSSSSSSSRKRKRRDKKTKRKAKKRTAGKLKSGINKKSHKVRIVRQELYPHQLLNFEFTNKELTFKDLTFPLLVAGEMEILGVSEISQEEKNARIEVLKKLAYHSAYLDIETILDIYATFVGNVEKGIMSWDSKRALERLEQTMLLRTISKQKNGQKSEGKLPKKDKYIPKVVYCLDYNKGRCSELDSHDGKWNGQACIKHHVCSRCLKYEGIKRAHPESDAECPNKSKTQ